VYDKEAFNITSFLTMMDIAKDREMRLLGKSSKHD